MIVAHNLHVRIFGMRPEMSMVFTAAATVERIFLEGELTLTSITDGRHGDASLHYAGCALDLDYPDSERFDGIAEELKARLTQEFDVAVEETHIHVEFQPKRSDKQAEIDHAWK